MTLRFKIDAKDLDKKFPRFIKQLNKATQGAAMDFKEKGKDFAKEAAPKFTGNTARMIRGYVKTGNNSLSVKIISPRTADYAWNKTTSIIGRKYKGSLPAFLNSDDYAKSTTRRGKPYYWDKTLSYMKRIKQSVLGKHFNKIKS